MYNDSTLDNLFTGYESGGDYVYPSADQNLVITFSGFYLSALDGDFTTDPVTITSETGEAEDITIGNAPAAVLTAQMLNPDGLMESLTWGDGSVYIGVATQSGTVASIPTGTLIYCDYGGTTIRATASQFVCTIGGQNYTRSISGHTPLGIVVDDANNKAYLYTSDNCVECNLSTHAFTVTTPADSFMVNKYRSFGGNTATIVTASGCPTGYTITDSEARTASYNDFRYVPMGVFDFSNVDAFGITFGVEAYDKMTLFDADATDWVNNLDFTTPKTLSTLISELMTEMGLTCTVDASAVNTSVQWSENPITNYAVTYRQVLKWLAEAIGCNVRMSRTGTVEFIAFHSTLVGNTITLDTIVGNSRTKGRYTVPVITKVICYNTVGAGYEDGTSGSDYYVVANPFIDPSGDLAPVTALLGLIDDIPAYYPTAVVNAYSDPRIDAGDFVTVTDMDGNTTFNIPVMHQTLQWNGMCTTQYVADGRQVRTVPDSLEGTGLAEVVNSNPSAVVNMIEAHGISADAITTGKLTVLDNNSDVLFEADKDNHSVEIAGYVVEDGRIGLSGTPQGADDWLAISLTSGFQTNAHAGTTDANEDGYGYFLGGEIYLSSVIGGDTKSGTIDGESIQYSDQGMSAQLGAGGLSLDNYPYALQVSADELYINKGSYITTASASTYTITDGTNVTTQSPTGITFEDGTATPTLRVLRRTLNAAGSTTVTLEDGICLAIVSHQNNSSTNESGLYIIQVNNTSSIRAISTAQNQTLSISGHTLTWTTTNTYRQLRLIYIS